MSSVRTRFAPSPTGYMHIGGMRTALFNWLWAKHTGGTFILRIDDTDQQRNMEEALDPIFRAFRWLGLNWDEGPEVGGDYGPYFQSERGGLYTAAVQKLLNSGKAYRDYEPPADIQKQREAAEKSKQNYLSSRVSLELSDAELQQYEAEGRPYVVRLLVPRDQKISIDDLVRGHVEWDCGLMPDPVLQRPDGSALYNMATVVDDALMNISHVIRAEEHLSNTPVQCLTFDALYGDDAGHTAPQFAHIPFITAPGSSKKLSKRDVAKLRNNPKMRKLFLAGDEVFGKIGLGDADTLNPVMVEYYERIGYLPAGVLNGLSRLGWSLDDKTENMSLEFVAENFELDRVVKKPAGFDPDKLMSYQAHWMGELSDEEKIQGCLPYLSQAGLIDETPTPETCALVGQVITGMGDRLKLFSDILNVNEFFLPENRLAYEEKAFNKRILNADESVVLLREFRQRLENTDAFDAESLDKLLHDFIEEKGAGIGDIIHALRVSVTGKPKGIGMFETLEILGKARTLARIDRALSLV